MHIIATTSLSTSTVNEDFKEFLQESMIEFVPRRGKSLQVLTRDNNAEGVIVWKTEGPVLYTGNEKFFFHPSMAKNRITSFRKFGNIDPLIRACDLQKDYSFLDCTLGLGADAIVASYFLPGGSIVGVEVSTPIAYVIKWGMKLYNSKMPWLNKAIQMIKVENCDHRTYLQQMEDNSFDIVYFDPMFRKPLMKSQAISPLRLVANHNPLEKDIIEEACRVAKKRVVMKEMVSSLEFERLGFTKLVSSPNNKIGMGVIEV